MADLPSILGGMAQGFLDFGKSAVDLFGTGGASIADLIESARTGKVTTKNSDDFRKWLYDTNDVKDAAAKGLGTALNGVQTVSDYIPGIGAVTRNPLFNAGQGALGGLADEFKMYGKDYDLGRAGQRAAVGAGGALASTGLADALKGSGNALLKSGTAQGLARGAVGGAIGAGGYTAIDGGSLGDVANSALQGAGMGAALGGTMGALQDLKPARTYDMALTDEEKAARIANAKNMLANEQDPERIAELNNQIKDLGGTIGNAPSENMKLYRGISAPDDATLQRYIDEMKDPNIAPTTYSGGSAYGQGYYFTPDEGLARYYASESGLPSTAIMEIEVPRDRFTEISKENGNRPADFDLAAIKRGVPEDIRYETGLKDFNDYLDNNGYWGSKTGGENPTYTIMRNDAVLNARRIDAPSLETALTADDMAVNSPRYLTDENGNPRTLYHGSPNANITEFDINQAGKNTMSGEHALFFTDDLGTADNFAHEQIPTESMFFVEKGKRGKVYPVNLEMNNPLDLDNLTDAQIEELWPYASQMGSWQGKDHFVKQLTDWRDKYHNAQQTKGYLDLDKLRDSQYDGIIARMYPNQDNQAREYAVFDNSKIKMLDDLQAVNDANIMASRILPDELDLGRTLSRQDLSVNSAKIAPGQLGLFDDMPTQTPKTSTRQTSLFDQPQEGLDYYGEDIETPATTPTNPYAPVDGQVTQAMRDRAADILGNWKKNGVPENELYNAINPDTLPLGYKEAIDVLDNMDAKKYLKDNLGVTDIKKAKFDKVLDYLFGDNEDAKRARIEMRDQQIESAKQKAKLLGLPGPSKNFVPTVEAQLREEVEYKIAKDISKSLKDISVDAQTGEVMPLTDMNLERLDPKKHSFRTGYTAAADEALSERLGIAPGNTPKYNGKIDARGAYGRYQHPFYGAGGDVAVFERKMSSPEDAISAMAHERLHSFQNESNNDFNKAGRYSKEVQDAYKDLHKDLESFKKTPQETAKRYGRSQYWQLDKEQEARMLQTYLENRGYAQAEQMQNKYRKGEWGSEINPAFDKFFDKLRDLSKRGVALPALTALFGGGALMANQQKDKEEVR